MKIISTFASLALIGLLLFLLLKIKNIKNENEIFSDPLVSSSRARAQIMDRNGVILSLDMPENMLLFNPALLKVSKNPSDVYRFLSDNISADTASMVHHFVEVSADDGIERYGEFLVLERNTEALRRNSIETKIEEADYSSFIFFLDTLKRVHPPVIENEECFKNFIGWLDVESRNGVSGIEKMANDFLISTDGVDTMVKKGSDVVLGLDIDFSMRLKDINYSRNKPFCIYVFDVFSGMLIGFYNNGFDMTEFDNSLLSFADISKSDIFNSLEVYAMLMIDPTLMEEYYCEGRAPCREAHGLVNLFNLIHCPSAIKNLRQNNYKNTDDLLLYIAQFGITDRNFPSLVNIGFSTYNDLMLPSVKYISNISTNGRDDVFTQSEDRQAVLKNSVASNYLKSVLREQCSDLKVELINDRFVVFMYQKDGLDLPLIESARKIVGNYYPD